MKVDFNSNDASFTAVSCASESFCQAGDINGDIYTYDGTHWSGAADVDSTGIDSISCPSSKLCVASDDSGDGLIYRDGAWNAPGRDHSGGGAISCVDASFCATDRSTFDGSVWTPTSDRGLGAISCASTDFCVSVGGADESTFDGNSWSTPEAIDHDPTGSLDSVSCPTTRFCVATDYRVSLPDNVGGFAVNFNGTAWAQPVSMDDGAPSVSCHSSTYCWTTDDNGDAVLGT